MIPRFVTLLCSLFLAGSHSVLCQMNSKDSAKVYRTPTITVVTTKAERQRSPVPFSALSRTDLEKLYTVQDLPALLSELPSCLFYSDNGNAVGYSTLSMRGFDQRRIAVLLNGVPQNDPEDHNVYWIDLPDIAASIGGLQVQRGAGHARYGHAAIGGSISMNTTTITDKRGISLTSLFGWQETDNGSRTTITPNVWRTGLEISSGLFQEGNAHYAVYGRLSRLVSNGYRDHSWTDMHSYFVSAARFDEKVTTQINIFGGPISDALAYTGLPKHYVSDPQRRRTNYSDWGYEADGKTLSYSVQRRTAELEQFTQPHYELLNDWSISSSVSLKSILFYYSGDGFFDYDASWADASTLRVTPDYGFPAGVQIQNALVRGAVHNRHGGWLPSLIYRHTSGELTAGLELRLHRSNHYGQIRYAEGLPVGFAPDYKFYDYDGERDIVSVFVREDYQISDKLRLNGELQLVHHAYRIANEKAGNRWVEHKTTDGTLITNGAAPFDIRYTFVNPRLGLLYSPDVQQEFFAMIALTSREPRMRNLYAAEDAYFGASPLFQSDTSGGFRRYDFSRPLVQPERLLDVEFGTRIMLDLWNLSATLYWMEFFQELVKNGQRDIFGVPVDGNAPRTRHYGVEIEAAGTAAEGAWGKVSARGNFTVSSNTFVDYRLRTADSELSLQGQDLPGFPSVMGLLRLSYENRAFTASFAARHVGTFFTDMVERSTRFNDAYTVCMADLSYSMQGLLDLRQVKIRLVVNNLFNALYSSGGTGKEFFPAAERSYSIGFDVDL